MRVQIDTGDLARDPHGTLARALRLPAFYGRNWDALTDCLRDADALTGLNLTPDETLILETDLAALTLTAPGTAEMLTDIIRDLAAERHADGLPARIILR